MGDEIDDEKGSRRYAILREQREQATCERDAEIARLRAEVMQLEGVVAATRQLSVNAMNALREVLQCPEDVAPLVTHARGIMAQLAAAQAETERWRTREASGAAEIERLCGEREATRVRIRAAQADAVALRGVVEQVHGLNVAWQGDLSEHCAGPLTVLDNMLAITEPIVSTEASPGAPLLDAVRGLVAAADELAKWVDDVEGQPCSATCTCRSCNAQRACAKALAAVRALVSPPQDTAGVSRGEDVS